MGGSEPAGGGELVLRCRVGPFDIALAAADVLEVHHAVEVTPLPGVPEPIVGVVDVRGELVPVLDLRRRFGLPAAPVGPSDAMVMVASPGRRVLFLVDEARSVESVPAAQLRDALELVPGGRYVRDVASTPTGPLVISDLGAFLSSEELVDLAATLRELEDAAISTGSS